MFPVSLPGILGQDSSFETTPDPSLYPPSSNFDMTGKGVCVERSHEEIEERLGELIHKPCSCLLSRM